jgi:hypothetical protein
MPGSRTDGRAIAARVLAVAALTIVWPVAQLAVFLARFGHLPPGGPAEALVFVPMGLVSGVAAVWLWHRAGTARRRRSVAIGYAVAVPFAFVGSLLGGLVIAGAWGALVFGALPLVAGCLAGYVAGGRKPGAEV